MKTIEKMSKNLKGMNASEMNQINGGAKYIVVTIGGQTYYIRFD
ncbi:hypothetical protein AGMMS50262_02990 [Bacteroidia bacterium]|nr:hypothetical protein AGMMS50262_02990 [Bacteroidia bacterium]